MGQEETQGILTFSGNGIAGMMRGFFSGSIDSLCLTRFVAVGDDGSSVALRFPSVVTVRYHLSRNTDTWGDCAVSEAPTFVLHLDAAPPRFSVG
jgi:hypothetical protein